jgi:hypothetical protein
LPRASPQSRPQLRKGPAQLKAGRRRPDKIIERSMLTPAFQVPAARGEAKATGNMGSPDDLFKTGR